MNMRKIYHNKHKSEHGAVSLFIVIFTTLLMTLVTVSFVQLMTSDQRQASDNDLSRSAYDSALAGVEDAKRALLVDEDCKGKDSQFCKDVRKAIADKNCNTLSIILWNSTVPEKTIEQSAGDEKLDQSYTCVKMSTNTSDFVGSLDPAMTSAIVPLKAIDSVSKIVVSWGMSKNGSSVDLAAAGDPLQLPPVAAWPKSRPALLRAQLIDGKGSFRLSDFVTKGSNSLFLYPTKVTDASIRFALDGKLKTGVGNVPQPASCDPKPLSGAYSCRVTLLPPSDIGAESETAFLSLGAFYGVTDFKIELLHGNEGLPVAFDGVQPEVDSTGRANNLVRRIISRVELGSTFSYPKAGLEVTENLCKNFSVTTEKADYKNNCTP